MQRARKTIRKPKNISQKDLDAVDSPEWSEEDFRRARPFAEVFPDLAASYRRLRARKGEPKKAPVSIRLSREVLDYFRGKGTGWQTRIDETLRMFVRAAK